MVFKVIYSAAVAFVIGSVVYSILSGVAEQIKTVTSAL